MKGELKIMITKFRHAGIVVRDMEKSLKFYRDALGFAVVIDEIEEGEYLSRLIGLRDASERVVKVAMQDGTVIELMEMLSPLAQRPATYDFNVIGCNHIAFTVNNIDQIYRDLKNAGVTFVSEPLSSTYDPVKTMFCYDPDKTLVQFVEIFDDVSLRKGLE
jgi:catechol 2,3-dioxygenase-like lactoylglutathione lyase family enzyme